MVVNRNRRMGFCPPYGASTIQIGQWLNLAATLRNMQRKKLNTTLFNKNVLSFSWNSSQSIFKRLKTCSYFAPFVRCLVNVLDEKMCCVCVCVEIYTFSLSFSLPLQHFVIKLVGGNCNKLPFAPCCNL